jgi:hypothetical protein
LPVAGQYSKSFLISIDLLTAIILAINFVISIWNSYAAGFNIGMQRRAQGPWWLKIYPVLGLSIGIAGEAYVLTIVIAIIANANGLIGDSTVAVLLAYNFLVLGGLITILGIGITIQTVYITLKHPTFWGAAGSIYNVFASIWNVFNYVRNFGVAANLIKEEEKEGSSNQGAVVILAVIAVLVAVLLSYIAFHAGRSHALGESPSSD